MTGPEHYRLAEALLAGRSSYESTEHAIARTAAAQAHATLALAAATAITPNDVINRREWLDVASAKAAGWEVRS